MIILFAGSATSTAPSIGANSDDNGTTSPLFAIRYNSDFTEYKENLGVVYDMSARWALPGGLRRFRFEGKPPKTEEESYRNYQTSSGVLKQGAHGDGVAIFDQNIDFPLVMGWIYEASFNLNTKKVTFVCGGAWDRMLDEYETDDPALSTDDTSVYLKSVLSDHCPASSSDQDKIEATGVQIGTYTVDTDTGNTPRDILNHILKMGTSTSGELLDFYFEMQSTDGIYPKLPRPVLKARSNSVRAWRIETEQLNQQSSVSSNIWQSYNDVSVYYGDPLVATASATDANSQAKTWTRELKERQPDLDSTQAEAWRDSLLSYAKEPQQQQSFTIVSPHIKHRSSGWWSLARMLSLGEDIEITDLPPSGDVLTVTDSNKAFRIISMDYSKTAQSERMRIVPDNINGDQRLDVILQSLGAKVGDIIQE